MISQPSSPPAAAGLPASLRGVLGSLERRQNTRPAWHPAHLSGALLAELRHLDRLFLVQHLAPAPISKRRRQSRGRP